MMLHKMQLNKGTVVQSIWTICCKEKSNRFQKAFTGNTQKTKKMHMALLEFSTLKYLTHDMAKFHDTLHENPICIPDSEP